MYLYHSTCWVIISQTFAVLTIFGHSYRSSFRGPRVLPSVDVYAPVGVPRNTSLVCQHSRGPRSLFSFVIPRPTHPSICQCTRASGRALEYSLAVSAFRDSMSPGAKKLLVHPTKFFLLSLCRSLGCSAKFVAFMSINPVIGSVCSSWLNKNNNKRDNKLNKYIFY